MDDSEKSSSLQPPLGQEVGVGGGVGQEAVAGGLHVAVEDRHHGEGPPSFGQVGEAVDAEAVREVGELDPGEARPFLQDPLHPEAPFPIDPFPELGNGEALGLGGKGEAQKNPKPKHALRL